MGSATLMDHISQGSNIGRGKGVGHRADVIGAHRQADDVGKRVDTSYLHLLPSFYFESYAAQIYMLSLPPVSPSITVSLHVSRMICTGVALSFE